MASKEKVIKSLKATLVSTKGSISIQQCNRDYRELEGEYIPYKRLGYSTLDDLFKSSPEFRVSRSGSGEMLVDAAPMRETSHITSLISQQKTATKRPSKSSFRGRLSNKSWRRPNVSYSSSIPRFSSYRQQTSYYSPQRSGYSSYSSNNKYASSVNTKNEYYIVKPQVPQTNRSQQSQRSEQRPAPPPLVQLPVPKPVAKPITNEHNKENLSRSNSAPKNTAVQPSRSVTRAKSEEIAVSSASNNLRIEVDSNAIQEAVVSKNQYRRKPTRAAQVLKSTAVDNAMKRLIDLRRSFNTIDLIPLPIPAVTNEKPLPPAPEELIYAIPEVPEPEPVREEPFPENATSEVKLAWLCNHLKLDSPVYKLHETKPKRGPSSFDCNVKIGVAYSASSYPNSTATAVEAREIAAAKLVAILVKELNALPASDPNVAMQRLATLLKKHPAGIWPLHLPSMYKDEYKENLPAGWEKLVASSSQFAMDRLANGNEVLIANDANPDTPPDFLNVSSESSENSTGSDLPPLVFPESNCWSVFVTAASSTLEVWFRLIGEQYSDAYGNLGVQMNKFYEQDGGAKVTVPLLNYWYVVRTEEAWLRVKLLDLIEDGKADVFLVDHGDDDVVAVSELRHLEPQFCSLPAQAILCRLEGLEELGSCPEAAEIVSKYLVNETLIAVPTAVVENEHTIPVKLYDTSGDKDVDLNALLIQAIADATKPELTPDVMKVEVGCVSREGRVWVCSGWGGAAIRSSLTLLTEPGPYARPPPPHTTLTREHLYAVHTEQGEWVRCCIRTGANEKGIVSLRLVDSGRSMLAPIKALHPLADWSPALNAIPAQAVQVRLAGAEPAAGALAERLRELLLGTSVLCRPVLRASQDNQSVPPVELFVRSEPQNILASVNKAINMEWDLCQKGKIVEEPKPPQLIDELQLIKALHRKKEKIFSRQPSGVDLPPATANKTNATDSDDVRSGLAMAKLPPIGHSFDVYVPMAANPWNFWIQDNSSRKELKAMMALLQTESPSMAQVSEQIRPGEIYAALYDRDNTWYRVSAVQEVGSQLVSVNFVDYGELSLVSRDTLRLLPPSHPARKLPAQAIKASLHEVWPMHIDWTPEDCVKFQELVVESQLVAIIQETTPKLSVVLIDTSTEDDIYIASVLCKEKRATNVKPAQ